MESWLKLQESRMQPSFVALGILRRYSTTEEVADSCGTCAHDALARSESVIVPGTQRQTIRSRGLGSEEVIGRDTSWNSLDTVSGTISSLHDRKI